MVSKIDKKRKKREKIKEQVKNFVKGLFSIPMYEERARRDKLKEIEKREGIEMAIAYGINEVEKDNSYTKIGKINTLVEIGGERVSGYLMELLRREESPQLKTQILENLIDIGRKEDLNGLMEFIGDPTIDQALLVKAIKNIVSKNPELKEEVIGRIQLIKISSGKLLEELAKE